MMANLLKIVSGIRCKHSLCSLDTGICLLQGLENRLLFAAFSAGDLVVYQVGIGSTLSSAATPVVLDEYATSGRLVQQINLPTAAGSGESANPLTSSGTATSEGLLTDSTNGHFLLLTGYDTVPGTASVSSSSSILREVGEVDSSGNINTLTTLGTSLESNNVRSATSTDGNALWVSGAKGIAYTTLGSTSKAVVLATQDSRQTEIFGGQLYIGSGSTTTGGIQTVGSGTPSSATQTITNIVPDLSSGGPYGYFFATLSGGTSPDTLYIADSSNGIEKYSDVSGTWTQNGTGVPTNGTTRSADGLVGVQSGSTVTLYVTDNSGHLVSLVDKTGYNASMTATPSLLATAAANTQFRGVALAPTAESDLPAWVAPGSAATFDGKNLNVTGSATIITDPQADSDSPVINVTGTGSLNISLVSGHSVHIASLNISSGGLTTVTTTAGAPTVLLIDSGSNQLTISGNGKLDLTDNFLDVEDGSLTGVENLLTSGSNGGLWTGNGITSTTAANNLNHLYALGEILNTNSTGGTLYGTFGGAATAGAADVLVRFTYVGDANLDGVVDGSDYSNIDSAYAANAPANWMTGDFNYDGFIDGSDYTLIDNAYNAQASPLAGPTAQLQSSPVGSPVALSSVQDIFSTKKIAASVIDGLASLIASSI